LSVNQRLHEGEEVLLTLPLAIIHSRTLVAALAHRPERLLLAP
jgi:hypothetical protein